MMTPAEEYEESYRIVNYKEGSVLFEGLSYEEAHRRCAYGGTQIVVRERPELLTDEMIGKLPDPPVKGMGIYGALVGLSLHRALVLEARAGNAFAREMLALRITSRRYSRASTNGDVAVPVTAEDIP